MESTQQVYIGNGETITVPTGGSTRYYLDLDKLEKLSLENLGKEVEVGATGDWFFTAQTIKDIKKIRSGEEYILSSSDWSKFNARIDGVDIDLTVEIPSDLAKIAGRDGYRQGIRKVEQWLEHIYTRGICKMKYEMLKEMQAELTPILKKYIDVVETLEKYSNTK